MDHAKAMQLARELAGPSYRPDLAAPPLQHEVYERLIRRIAGMVLPVNMQQEFLAHFPFYGSEPDDVLCVDEGCPQHGTPHVCRTGLEPGQPDLTGDLRLSEYVHDVYVVEPDTTHTGHEL